MTVLVEASKFLLDDRSESRAEIVESSPMGLVTCGNRTYRNLGTDSLAVLPPWSELGQHGER